MNLTLFILGLLNIFVGISLMFDEEPNPHLYRFKMVVIEICLLILLIIEIYNHTN